MKIVYYLFGVCGPLFLWGCGGGSAQAPISQIAAKPVTAPIYTILPVPDRAPLGPDYHPKDKGWVLVWSDEFEGSALDPSKWEAEQSCWGGGNDERQCYTDREKNVEVANGVLRLKAYPEMYTGPEFPQGWPEGRGAQITQPYTSGKVRTRQRARWTYGRFEARIKLPKGQGTWPAFWMLPSDNHYGAWAASGEIDIMEAVNLTAHCEDCSGTGGENRTSAALHYGGEWPDNTYKTRKSILPGGSDGVAQYHVYAAEWGAGRINWFVDGVKFFSLSAEDWYSSAVKTHQNPNAPFDQNFYLMLNLAVGGGLSEDHNAKGLDPDSFPAEMLIDWVRVYQCDRDKATGRACMNDEDE